MPIYMEGSEVESVSENRFYFDSDKLIRWLDPTKSKVAKSKFSEKEAELSVSRDEILESLE